MELAEHTSLIEHLHLHERSVGCLLLRIPFLKFNFGGGLLYRLSIQSVSYINEVQGADDYVIMGLQLMGETLDIQISP